MHCMADVNVHMMCDEFMSRLTAELGVEIPPFKLHRRMRVTRKGKDGETALLVPSPAPVHPLHTDPLIPDSIRVESGLSGPCERSVCVLL